MTIKTPTDWDVNPAANTNLQPYDSATQAYDSTTDTYDGVVAGESFESEKDPVVWSAA